MSVQNLPGRCKASAFPAGCSPHQARHAQLQEPLSQGSSPQRTPAHPILQAPEETLGDPCAPHCGPPSGSYSNSQAKPICSHLAPSACVCVSGCVSPLCLTVGLLRPMPDLPAPPCPQCPVWSLARGGAQGKPVGLQGRIRTGRRFPWFAHRRRRVCSHSTHAHGHIDACTYPHRLNPRDRWTRGQVDVCTYTGQMTARSRLSQKGEGAPGDKVYTFQSIPSLQPDWAEVFRHVEGQS